MNQTEHSSVNKGFECCSSVHEFLGRSANCQAVFLFFLHPRSDTGAAICRALPSRRADPFGVSISGFLGEHDETLKDAH